MPSKAGRPSGAVCPLTVGISPETWYVCNDDFCVGGSLGSNLASRSQFWAQADEDYLVRVSVVPDCRADFNNSGGPQSVQDIFDFLAAWFGGC